MEFDSAVLMTLRSFINVMSVLYMYVVHMYVVLLVKLKTPQ